MRKNVMQVFHSVRTWRVFCRHWQALSFSFERL